MPAVVDDVADSAEVDETSADSPMYDAQPLIVTPERAEVVSKIMRETMKSDNLFMSYPTCEDACGECNKCVRRLQHISRVLSAPDSMVFEVWHHGGEGSDLRGALYFTRVTRQDAVGHYIFFDNTLGADKTDLLKRVLGWAFEDHGNWTAKQRITVEVPEYAFILARHAQKKLGFGGPFEHEAAGKQVEVEGVKRNAATYKEEPADVMILGLTREEFEADGA